MDRVTYPCLYCGTHNRHRMPCCPAAFIWQCGIHESIQRALGGQQ